MNTSHLVRSTDPLSSVMAAEKAPRFAHTHRARIVSALAVCLQICPERGATAHEIAQESGLTVVQVDRRLIELQRAGLARVLQHDDGADYIRDGYRCWTLGK